MSNNRKAVEVVRMMYGVVDRHISPQRFDASERQNIRKQIVGELLSGLIKTATPIQDDPSKSWTTTDVSNTSKDIKLPPASKFPDYQSCINTITGAPYNIDTDTAAKYCTQTNSDSDTNQPSKSGTVGQKSILNIMGASVETQPPAWAHAIFGGEAPRLPNPTSSIRSAAQDEDQAKLRTAMTSDPFLRRVPRRTNSIKSASTTSSDPRIPAWARITNSIRE